LTVNVSKLVTVDAWVAEVNRLAREIDRWADAIHPSAWPEQLGDLWQEYATVAAHVPAELLQLDFRHLLIPQEEEHDLQTMGTGTPQGENSNAPASAA